MVHGPNFAVRLVLKVVQQPSNSQRVDVFELPFGKEQSELIRQNALLYQGQAQATWGAKKAKER